jgi:hypothetical protein
MRRRSGEKVVYSQAVRKPEFQQAESEGLNEAIHEYITRRTRHNAPVVDALRYIMTIEHKHERMQVAVELFGSAIQRVKDQDIIQYLKKCGSYKRISDTTE